MENPLPILGHVGAAVVKGAPVAGSGDGTAREVGAMLTDITKHVNSVTEVIGPAAGGQH